MSRALFAAAAAMAAQTDGEHEGAVAGRKRSIGAMALPNAGAGSSGDPAPVPSHEHLPGPRSLDEVLAWPSDFVERVQVFDSACGSDYSQALQHNACGGLIVTTAYSGMGGAETAAAQIVDTLASKSATPHAVVFHSSCDMDILAQRALQAHTQSSRSQHLFTNVLDRLPVDALHACKEVEAAKFRLLDEQLPTTDGKAAQQKGLCDPGR